MNRKDQAMARVIDGMLIVLICLSVCTAAILSRTKARTYKHIIYNYQDILQYNDTSKWDYIYSKIGHPDKDYYYDMPRYSHFWDARKARKIK